jgi:hypothetical protein
MVAGEVAHVTQDRQDRRSPLPTATIAQRPFPITHSISTSCPQSKLFCVLTRPCPSNSVPAFVEVADPALREGLTSELFILGPFLLLLDLTSPQASTHPLRLTRITCTRSCGLSDTKALPLRHLHHSARFQPSPSSERPHLHAPSNRTIAIPFQPPAPTRFPCSPRCK